MPSGEFTIYSAVGLRRTRFVNVLRLAGAFIWVPLEPLLERQISGQ
jgi:hypothetical protein